MFEQFTLHYIDHCYRSLSKLDIAGVAYSIKVNIDDDMKASSHVISSYRDLVSEVS